MKLKGVVQDLNDVPEKFRTLYQKAEDGKFYLQELEYDDPTELKTALQKERERAEELNKQLKSKDGIDRDEYQKLKEAQEKREIEEAKKRGEFDKILAQKDEALAKMKSDSEARLREAEIERDRDLVEMQAMRAIESHKAKSRVLLQDNEFRASLKVVKDAQGNRVVQVVDKDGTPRLTKQEGKTGPMTLEEYVGTFRDHADLSCAFPASGAGGGGATGSTGTPAAAGVVTRDQLASGQFDIKAAAEGKMVLQT